MNLRSLGKTAQVSEIGLGTAQLANADGRFPGVKPVPIDEARAILRAAVDRGVTFFDTADGYGCAEVLLGELPSSVKRGVVIATKAGLRDDGMRDFSTAYLAARIERSLGRLGVDCLELFQLNKPSAADLADGRLLSFLADQKKAGRIRRAGVVVGEPASVEACLSSGVLDAVQVLHHLLYDGALGLMRRAAGLGSARATSRAPPSRRGSRPSTRSSGSWVSMTRLSMISP
ncbi:MAG: aldo/keto reductase [Elusimicrobia bacterium]|nr:aldo/keto reductase [Elusimicrobiota bacterium]